MNMKISNLSVFTTGNPDSKPIFFVHGFPFDHYMWDSQIKKFSDKYYCVTYDIRGLGNSPAGEGQFTIETFVDDLEIILTELNLVKPVLCGLSMGGYISLRTVERMESKFSALILCDTKSLPDDNEGKIKRAAGIKAIDDNGVEAFVKQFVFNCFSVSFMKNHKTEYEAVINRSINNNPMGVKGCLLAMAARTDTSAYLPEISIPTLIICGSEDKLTPPNVMKEMSRRIQGSKFVLVDSAGHMTPIEAPEIVNSAIEEFLKSLF